MQPPRILLFAGSTAPDAPASLLAAAFTRELAFLDAEPTRIALADHPLPLFDADAPPAPPPQAAARLRELVRSHHAVFVASPSRAGSIPPLLHNLLAWLGPREEPRRGPPPLFAAAAIADDDWSAGAALADLTGHLTIGLGASLVGGLAVGRAARAFDTKGGLDDPRLAAALTRLARDLVAASRDRTNAL